jgi:hypothetical protein
MATIHSPNPVAPLVSVEEYLNIMYHPDCEYIDGRIEERNWGQYDHGTIQALLAQLFQNHTKDWGCEPSPKYESKSLPPTSAFPS